MKLLDQIIDAKPHRLISIAPDATVFEALNLLARYDIGALLVMAGGKALGVFSERDFARKVLLMGKDAREIPVSQVMSEKVICVNLDQTVEECMAIMTQRHIRHLPVLAADGSVYGFLSIGDLVKEMISEKAFIIEQLTHYITH